ncbi:MAG: diacylglycerol kinase family protein [Anaerolineae bacterium]|nr:diacylglycerol kinase family protein [Anaerolineae bacterium]
MAPRQEGCGLSGTPRLLARVRCALRGWAEAWRCQPNLRIQAAIAVGVTALGLYLRLGAGQWAILVLTYCVVLAAELLNSALEALTDIVSPTVHPVARRAKDIAAGAVFLAAVGSVIVGLLILGPPLLARLR